MSGWQPIKLIFYAVVMCLPTMLLGMAETIIGLVVELPIIVCS